MNLWQKFIANTGLRRTVVLLGIISILFLARSMLSVILLTFIFTFLVIRLIGFVQKYIKIPSSLIVIILYLGIIVIMYGAITIYVPKLIVQSEAMFNYLMNFYQHPPKGTNDLMKYVNMYINKSEIMKQAKTGVSFLFSSLASIGTMSFTFFMSLLMSFFYTVECKQVKKFSSQLLEGPNAWLFSDIYYFAKKFTNTFGVVLEAQFMIALINTIITTGFLAILKMPQLVTLSVLIFILSMIPVAGVILSFLPMAFIGYSVGGIRYVIYIVIMLMVVHALEAYVLNPKLMSSKTDLPIFYTFIILFIAERLFGVWGLIVGIPIFTFILDVLGVKIKSIRKQPLRKLEK
ncbi:AI-2E family transporter [Ligilactobacillus ceti]|uniref:Permease n=1 Tax=Ligilactobacillus ceti DSM 22408 TaxID=1122146 RepID=A0A0R2KQ86_9LACO|nr:AI-2E family transporter [Ligilactobacillus ceti]KRN88413.1 hypothetical protein IV53_GL000377 [Ligilactobacillus ceti DSM 22408]